MKVGFEARNGGVDDKGVGEFGFCQERRNECVVCHIK